MDKRYAIGNFICELRQEKGFTQKELGELMGVTNKAVSKWENGASLPRAEELSKLSVILGCTMDELLNGRRLEDGDSTGEHNETEPISEPRELTEEEKRLIELYSPYHPTEEESFGKRKSEKVLKLPLAYDGIGKLEKKELMRIIALPVLALGWFLLMRSGRYISVEWVLILLFIGLGFATASTVFLIIGTIKASQDERSFKNALIAAIVPSIVFSIISRLFVSSYSGLVILLALSTLADILKQTVMLKCIGRISRSFESGEGITKKCRLIKAFVIAANSVCAVLCLAVLFINNDADWSNLYILDFFTLITPAIAACGIIELADSVIMLFFFKRVRKMLEE